ncbi:hypothetical protein [Gloeocapsa sp. PCC 73106]|uniref:hypothetical protein n=1 Tax=Gloeocapsa sp. PCC 73106 TaxID=102232 RepID=UPI0002AC6B79|nr:hypothetical protein [Gloeocapsa sp. PCC 73106]ELS00125.1 hypothetical protein GLO73106DRAFT_00039800 [Gloeocapsa sp. PCC 73106]
MRHYIGAAIGFALVACSSAPSPETEAAISALEELNSKSPETEAAISALKGLNSKLDIGLNFVEYTDALRDGKVIIDQAIEADPKSKTNQVVQKVMNAHIAALELWRCRIKGSEYVQGKCTKEVCETLIFPLYPEIKEILEFQLTFAAIEEGPVDNAKYADIAYYLLDYEKVLQHLWYLNEEELNSLESK